MSKPAPASAELQWRWAGLVAAGCLLVSGWIFATRAGEAWQAVAVAPGMTVTTGFEEESILAVWRAAHGQAVYTDPTRLPYASAYFNWLFYASYAVPARLAVDQAGDAVIPRVGRLLTALGALAGAGGLFWLLRKILCGHALVAAALAGFSWGGPLVGWWAHTVRPDVWALALETAALGLLLATWRRHPVASALVSGALFYAAWSFKQTYVLGLATAFVFLLGQRQWRPAVLLAVGSTVLVLATWLALGPAYRAAFRATAVTNLFSLGIGLANLGDMLRKCAPLWLLGAILLLYRQPGPASPASSLAADTRRLGLLGLGIATPLSFALSCKAGAISNYYFTTQIMLVFLSAGLLAVRPSPKAVLLAFSAAFLLQIAVATGRVGQINLRPQTDALADLWSGWQHEPEPRYAVINALNEPWLNPHSPSFVLAFNYGLNREAGQQFEAGGLGGLVSAGFFRTLLLPAETKDTYDNGSLRRYARGATRNGLTVFRRIQSPEK